jgi:uncharacterized membrane protein YjjB (DUF3815 family)
LVATQHMSLVVTWYQLAGISYQVPVTSYQVHATWYQVPATRYQVPGTSYQVPGTRYQLPATSYQVPGTWYQLPGTRYQVPGIRYQVPAIRYLRPSLQHMFHFVFACVFGNETIEASGCRLVTGSLVYPFQGRLSKLGHRSVLLGLGMRRESSDLRIHRVTV